MANRYWVGGNANWDATAGTKWATTSGGAGGAAVPTAADEVFLDNGTGTGNVTIPTATTVVCRALDCTGYVGILAFASTTAIINIGDATAGTGGNACKFVAGMTLTLTGIGAINFLSTNASVQTLTSGGKTLPNITINAGTTATLQLADALTSSGAITVTQGIFSTNNQTVNATTLASNNSNTRTLTLGSSAIGLSLAGTAFNFGTVTNLTITANTAVATLSGAGAGISIASKDFNGLSFVLTGSGTVALPGNGQTLTCANFTRTGTATKTDGMFLNGGITCTGTFTANGNSATNRLLTYSSTTGTSKIITAATVVSSNSDWRDVTGAGAGSWNLSAITGLSGDCGGNSGITFTTPATQTATGTASFSWSTHGWTSRVPLPQDTVSVPNSFVAGRTVTVDMPRIGKDITFSCSGTPAVTFSIATEMYGSLNLSTTLGTVTLSGVLSFFNRAAVTLTTGGNTLAGASGFSIAGTSSLALGDALNSSGPISNASTGGGWFLTNSFSVTCLVLQLFNAVPTTTCDFGTSTVTITSTAATNVIALTTNPARAGASTATFVISVASASTRTILWYGATIGTLTYTVAASTGVLILGNSGAMGTIGTLNVGIARTLRLLFGATLTISTAFNVNGSSGNVTTLDSTTAGTPATISKTGAQVSCDYLSIKDSTASGSVPFYAGNNSTNVSGNTNWVFTAPPNGNFLELF